MLRRRLLKAIPTVGVVAGCTTSSEVSCKELPGGDATDESPEPSFPRLDVEFETVAETGVDGSVELLRQYDRSQPAEIRVHVMNATDERREFTFGAPTPLADIHGEHVATTDILVALPVDGAGMADTYSPPTSPSGWCWQLDDLPPVSDALRRQTLDPCERISRSYALYAAPENQDCLAGGEYRFEEGTFGDVGVRFEFSVFVRHDG